MERMPCLSVEREAAAPGEFSAPGRRLAQRLVRAFVLGAKSSSSDVMGGLVVM